MVELMSSKIKTISYINDIVSRIRQIPDILKIDKATNYYELIIRVNYFN